MKMIDENSKTIAIDFDGTIVEHAFPEIGKDMLFAFETLMALQKKGHKLILWTFRHGKELDETIEFCRQKGIQFYAVNKNYPEEEWNNEVSRKIQADIFIDDRNIGGFQGWSKVWQILHPEGGEFNHQLENVFAHTNYQKSATFWEKLMLLFKK